MMHKFLLLLPLLANPAPPTQINVQVNVVPPAAPTDAKAGCLGH